MMNQRLTLQQLRGLLRPETALVGLILVLALVWFRLSPEVEEAQNKKLAQQLATAQRDLGGLKDSSNKDSLMKELEQLKTAPEPPGPQNFPSLREGLDLSTDMISYAAQRKLDLSTFDVARKSVTVGKVEYPALSYSIAAQGTTDALVGALKLAEGFPTAMVQKLEFKRASESQWEMKLNLAVFYSK